MLAVTPVASPALAALMASRRSSRLSELSTAMVAAWICKVPLCPSALERPRCRRLRPGARDLLDLDGVAGDLTTIGDRDANDRRCLGRGLRRRRGWRRTPAWPRTCRLSGPGSAARAASRARSGSGRASAGPGTRRSSPGCSRCAARCGRSAGAWRDQSVDRLLQVDPGGQARERGPAAAVDHQAVEVETGRHALVRSGALVDQRPERSRSAAYRRRSWSGGYCSINSPVVRSSTWRTRRALASSRCALMHGAIGKEPLERAAFGSSKRRRPANGRSHPTADGVGWQSDRPADWAPRALGVRATTPAWALRQDPWSWRLHIPVIHRPRELARGRRTSPSLAYCSSRSRFWGS